MRSLRKWYQEYANAHSLRDTLRAERARLIKTTQVQL